MTNRDLQRCLTRDETVSTLRALLPFLPQEDVTLSPTRGGRKAALTALASVKPESYARSRNFLNGDVTRLSMYLRHGVLTLAEVRDHVLERVADPQQAGKLINELAWRDYWQRLYMQLGEGIWDDREPYKTGYVASDYATELAADVVQGTTTLACMDSFSEQLTQTGYLHNHARMWFAAYVVHWRRIRWQEGAGWFLQHLLDGDPASNNLSWQWVASTFASKPYVFNRENLERYTAGIYCRNCRHAEAGTCPFEQSYEALEQTLFPRLHLPVDAAAMPTAPRSFTPATTAAATAKSDRPPSLAGRPLLWVHTDSLNPDSPMMQRHPDSNAAFIWNTEWLLQSGISLRRVIFIAECLQEMQGAVDIRAGDPATELLAAAAASGAAYILAQRTPDPRLRAAALIVERTLPIVWYDPPSFVEETRAFDLKRFSRYWKRAESSAMQLTRT